MVQSRLAGLDYQKLLSWHGFHEEHDLRNSSKVFALFKTVIKRLITNKPDCFLNIMTSDPLLSNPVMGEFLSKILDEIEK